MSHEAVSLTGVEVSAPVPSAQLEVAAQPPTELAYRTIGGTALPGVNATEVTLGNGEKGPDNISGKMMC
jgi:hypothetical protein